MGEQNVISELKGEQLRSFIGALLKDLRALERMLETGKFESDISRIGAEQELFLVGPDLRPAAAAPELLKKVNDAHFTTELARFNIEINLDPLTFQDDCLSQLE